MRFVSLVRPLLALITCISAVSCGGGDSTAPTPSPVASVAVTPATASVELGQTQQLTAVARDAQGNALTDRPIEWRSADPTLATVSGSGLVTAVGLGPVTITATSEGRSGTTTITVVPVPVASVAVTPATASVELGRTQQLTAVARDAQGNALTDRPIEWRSADPTLATVSGSGLVTAVGLGPVTITATSEGRSGTTTITVVPVPVASVAVTPATASVELGRTQQLTAVARDAQGNVLTGRTISWTSSNPAVVTVSESGLMTSLAVGGPVVVTATVEERSGTATAYVTRSAIATAIANPNDFISVCPTADPAYQTIRADFEFLSDRQPSSVDIVCSGSYQTNPSSQRSDELLAMQTFRIAYYMNEGTRGKLPWTQLGLYDWIKSQIAGVNFLQEGGFSSCCSSVNGKLYFNTARQSANSLASYTDPGSAFFWLGLFMHEVRHVSGPGHVTGCAFFPLSTDPLGCDATYDLANLGSYGVQHWLFAEIATGQINIGIGCLPPASAQSFANRLAGYANVYLGRFVTGTPPPVAAAPPYGGSCLSQ